MIKRSIYEEIFKDSPLAYIYISGVKDECEKYVDWKFLDTNKAFDRFIRNSTIKIKGQNLSEFISKEEIDKCNIDKELKICNKINKYTLIHYNTILNININVDIYHVEDDDYIIIMTEVHEDNIVLSDAFKNSPFALWIKDRNGKYLYVNEKLEYLNNKTSEETLGKTDYELWDHKVWEKCNEEDEHVMSTRKIFSCQSVFWVEPSKKYAVYEVTKWPYKDKYNNILGTIGIAIEIVDDTELRKNLIQNQEAFESIVNYSEEVFIISDRTNVTYISPSFNKLFEDSPDRLYNDIKSWKSYFNKDDMNGFDVKFEEEIEFTKRSKLSKTGDKWLLVKTIPIRDERGYIINKITTIRDISQRKKLDLELETLRMDFFANISHELRTPINVMYSALQLIKKNNYNNVNLINERHLNIIEQNSLRLLRLVNNLIDITKIDAGYLDYNPQNFDIINFVENICMSVCEFANQSNIDFIFDTEVEECIVSFDLDMMERIILNLLSNAIKFNKDNGRIDVCIYYNEDYININIKDSGIGIAEKGLEKIFGRFEQVRNKKEHYKEGSGIGLSLVKSLVDMHNGKISIKSEIGKGSEISVSIPNVICTEENKIDNTYLNDIDCVNKMNIEFSDIY